MIRLLYYLDAEDYELAASYFNICRRQGIQEANTNFLICAIGEAVVRWHR